VGAKPIKKVAAKSQERTKAPSAEPSTHVDLMAWTRRVHAGQGHH